MFLYALAIYNQSGYILKCFVKGINTSLLFPIVLAERSLLCAVSENRNLPFYQPLAFAFLVSAEEV